MVEHRFSLVMAMERCSWYFVSGSYHSWSYTIAVPASRGSASITAMQTDTSPIPLGYSLNRTMASIRLAMFFPPLDTEEVPGTLAYRSLAMDNKIPPYSRRSSPCSRSSTRLSQRDSISFSIRLHTIHRKGLHQWRQRRRHQNRFCSASRQRRWSSSCSRTFSSHPSSGSTSTGRIPPQTNAVVRPGMVTALHTGRSYFSPVCCSVSAISPVSFPPCRTASRRRIYPARYHSRHSRTPIPYSTNSQSVTLRGIPAYVGSTCSGDSTAYGAAYTESSPVSADAFSVSRSTGKGSRTYRFPPAGSRIRRASRTHTPYCHFGDSLSAKIRLHNRSTAAVMETVRVCSRNSHMFDKAYTSISSSIFRSLSASVLSMEDSFRKAAIRSPAAPPYTLFSRDCRSSLAHSSLVITAR